MESAIFSPFSSENIITGTETGVINIYDLRASKKPVMHSFNNEESHRSPIIGLRIIGGRNSNNLITISEEGRVCKWSLGSIHKPISRFDLTPIDSGARTNKL